MRTLDDVKKYLDQLSTAEKSSIIAKSYHLGPPTITEEGCKQIESLLDIQLPNKYSNLLMTYDWADVRIGNLRFYAKVEEIIKNNRKGANPCYSFYKSNGLIEIGNYEADRISMSTRETNVMNIGEIHYIDHTTLPTLRIEFVSSDFEQLIVFAAIDLRLKKEADYFILRNTLDTNEEETLFGRIMEEIVNIEPRASDSSFWNNLIRGF